MSKQAIIDKIISDAEIIANGIIEEASAKVDEIMSAAAADCYRYVYDAKHEQDVLKKDIAQRSDTVAQLDSRKLVLVAKAKVIDEVFATALEKARNLPKEKYKKLIFGMLESAQDGDVITISEREKGIVTEASIKELATKKKIKLTLNKELGDFDGGIILSNNGIDKNMTLEVEIASIRDEYEAKVAKELFK